MGNSMDKAFEDTAIEQLNSLSKEAKQWLNHHLNNSLTIVLNSAEIIKRKYPEANQEADFIIEAVLHIVEDLKKTVGR